MFRELNTGIGLLVWCLLFGKVFRIGTYLLTLGSIFLMGWPTILIPPNKCQALESLLNRYSVL